ncbi:MAG: signal peptidase II [Candidatus Sabulitectum sp.]|nr:signal peptidase II [Candidatus Sabulitectum sp.]
MRSKPAAFTAAAVVLLLDQATKYAARHVLMDGIPRDVIGSVFKMTLRYNTGAAFSLGWGGPVFLSVFTAVACFLLIRYMMKIHKRKQLLWLGVILGGAIGNLLDRVAMGKVTDFIDIGSTGWRWPTFNVADIAICIGGIAVFFLFKGEKRLEVPTKETEK